MRFCPFRPSGSLSSYPRTTNDMPEEADPPIFEAYSLCVSAHFRPSDSLTSYTQNTNEVPEEADSAPPDIY